LKSTKAGFNFLRPGFLILDSIYGLDGEIQIACDIVSRNGISYTKNELADKVCIALLASTEHHPQFQHGLLEPVAARVV